MRSDTPTPSRLLALPAELRNRIYEYALFATPPEGQHSIPVTSRHKERWQGARAVLRTCRQIHAEARPIFYNVNCFYFENLHDWKTFAIAGGETYRRNTRSIMLHAFGVMGTWDKSKVDAANALLLALPKLDSLVIFVCGIAIATNEQDFHRAFKGLRELKHFSIEFTKDTMYPRAEEVPDKARQQAKDLEAELRGLIMKPEDGSLK